MYHSAAAAMEQPPMSRGFTAGWWLLDLDDEVPRPKPCPLVLFARQPAESARLLGDTGLHPPPPKQRRVSAVSAPVPEPIENASTADHGSSTAVSAPPEGKPI